jgi:hypothetical protein
MSKQKITVSLEPQVIEKLKIQAIKEKRSVSAILNELAKSYLASKPL